MLKLELPGQELDVVAQETARYFKVNPQIKRNMVHYQLSPAQKRVAKHVIAGWSHDQIMNELEVCMQTVKYHITQINKKLGTRTKLDIKTKLLRSEK